MADEYEVECPTCGALALRHVESGDVRARPDDTVPSPLGPMLPLDVLAYTQDHPLVLDLIRALILSDYQDRHLGYLLSVVRRASQPLRVFHHPDEL
jgi:hypothetical protein